MQTDRQSKLHWEDVAVGTAYAYGAYPVTKDEIFEFARTYDPQPHHVDEEAAKLSLVKGLCASGWHSCAIFMRMLYDGFLVNYAALGGNSIDEVKWMKPVRPDHVLKARSTCLEKRLLASRPGIGICRMKHEILNQEDELLMTMENTIFMAVRDPGSQPATAPKGATA
jgi:acyl dehydratase